jgi:hypothetical protein
MNITNQTSLPTLHMTLANLYNQPSKMEAEHYDNKIRYPMYDVGGKIDTMDPKSTQTLLE